ncbi:hypothetical protein [Sulfurimonas sp.]|uniref:hypothetical protein n=1 Tax=Sulfurimonas sp. TaxID=2022749 RepID=UPI002620C2B8|nr:hypothetical protein [Sulfurimonas sp.]MDD5158177.1 hypothetical protein [Sulfurimonas sp.]
MSEIIEETREVKQSEDYKGEIYFNGFEVGFSNSDASIHLRRNSETVALLNMSFGTLKTLSIFLTDLINDIEDRTGTVNSIPEFKKKMEDSLLRENEK